MLFRHRIKYAIVFVLSIACIPAEVAWAQAYCALRDPVQQIYAFYPKAQGYRSIVRVVSPEARASVGNKLPFDLHINELGKHTLYCTQQVEGTSTGLVHVRSEKGQWGLVEIAWSLNLDLRIQGMRFQRCRNRSKADLESDAFVSQLIDKGFDEIRQMLSENGQSIVPGKIWVPTGTEELAATILRSALKTIVVTQVVWERDLQELQAYENAIHNFPQAMKISRVDAVYTNTVDNRLGKIAPHYQTLIDRDSVEAYRVFDGDDRLIGILVRSTCHVTSEPLTLWWSINSSGKIQHVEPDGSWPNHEIQETFTGLEGMGFDESLPCSTPGQVVATEVLAIGGTHTEP